MQFQLGVLFRGCSNSLMFKLPYSLGPQIAPTAIPTLYEHRAAGPFTPRNGQTITRPNCGIATCPNRSIDTMGLSPTRLRPCWPLPRLPRSLGPQVAPTAEALSLQGGQAVYTTHSSVGYLPRDVASLRVRYERLTRLDFHQLDCSLVGCSGVPIPIYFCFQWIRILKYQH
jgi:hypothetical protein